MLLGREGRAAAERRRAVRLACRQVPLREVARGAVGEQRGVLLVRGEAGVEV